MSDATGTKTSRKISAAVINEQVKRNHSRFPEDFMFRLTATERLDLNRSQFATGSQCHRDPRFTPYAFTEHGAIMAATVLSSPRAVEVSIYVVRACPSAAESASCRATTDPPSS